MSIKQEYRFEHCRNGERPETYEVKSFEGADQKECDRKAEEYGEEIAKKPEMRCEFITVYRIDAPAVPEKATSIWKNKEIPNDEWSL